MEENNQNNVPETGAPQQPAADNAAPQQNAAPTGDQPGKGMAIASLVLGIISIVCWCFGASAFVGIITGIIGLICASSAKKQGFVGGMRTAGFVCSIVGLIGSALVFIACVACLGTLGSVAGTAGVLDELSNMA